MRNRVRHLPADERRAITVGAVVSLSAEQYPSEITKTAAAILQAVMERVAERLLARFDDRAHSATSPMAALDAMFTAHIQFIADHPGTPRLLFGELQHAEPTEPKRMVQTLIRRYGERLHRVLEQGKESGELAATLDNEAAATLFIGMIQGLLMQSLLAGDVDRFRRDALGVFAIFRRGIEAAR